MASDSDPERLARLRLLLKAASRLKDREHPAGQRARAELPATTGLSPQGVDFALQRSLETDATDTDLAKLMANTPVARRAHVLLSANVFTAALRAIAIGLAASPHVEVRPSRREPLTARLLHQQAPQLFTLRDELCPEPGDHVWAYGGATTIDDLKHRWRGELQLHAYGPGHGIVVVDAESAEAAAAEALAEDVVLFDQQGCLSPTLVFVLGGNAQAQHFAGLVASALERLEQRIPMGTLPKNLAATRRQARDTLAMAGPLITAGKGWVSIGTLESARHAWLGGRALHTVSVPDWRALDTLLQELKASVTTVGMRGSSELARLVTAQLPSARIADLGQMQRPPLDGPADLRGLA